MSINKSLLTGSTTMLILKLLEETDMYGYEMIEELSKKSQNIFKLKAGTLYPLLHGLEHKDMLTSYEKSTGNQRIRKYYSITKTGRKYLNEKTKEWKVYTVAINNVLGGVDFAPVQ
ncbi:MAG: helix-turn-helix transcriptional regulator [Desulfitobacteriaceae bacterium]|nr:helix-turn-helix transcriptional regulator [Desulfitobacteriaceae bacterium]MDD4346899.1 helix-turn-helix transcriptional regulator [Desulfitobacteriaceae bacterium]MDD4401281.1 helix-turn-helix transcriptional regulator [Desulfitobacteriaceae bacterium]